MEYRPMHRNSSPDPDFTSISHAVAGNGEIGLLVTVTRNGGLLQNYTAVRNLLGSADEAEGEKGAAHGSTHHRIGTRHSIS